MAVRMVLKQKIDSKTLKKIVKELPEGEMRIGWEKHQTEDNGEFTWKVAYLNEVGHNILRNGKTVGYVVARPFLSLAAGDNQYHWQQAWRRLIRGYIADKYKHFRTIMNLFCQLVIADIKNLVEVERPFAPLKPSTKARKKAKRHPEIPLVDYGTMMDKLSHETHIKG